MSDYKLKNVCDFDLAQTLECGQCFHFVKLDENDYVLTAKGRVLHVSQQADTVTFYDTEEDEYVNVWKDYFDMDRDYSAVKKKLLENDNKLKDAIESMWGVRILNQDFFETLISFIISQNKQIPHIKKIVADISAKFGTYKGTYGGADMYTFPTLEQLNNASEEDFKELKTGFRAPYIMDAIRRNMAGQFNEKELKNMDYDSCIKELMTIKGVGEKVANCVSLFGLGKKEAFPVDVWIKRIMENLYLDIANKRKQIEIANIKKCNEYTNQYGLMLTDNQITNLLERKKETLKETGRIEFREGIIDRIIKEFCDSPYINQDNYALTLYELVEVFYEYKNETMDLITDDELIIFMKKSFDGICEGDIEYLAGTIMYKMRENLLKGKPLDYEECDNYE